MLLASAFDQSRYFKAAETQDAKKLKIKGVTEEEVGQEKKLVVWFDNDRRGLVLNKTNNRILRAAFGDDCAGWEGKIIVVFPTTVAAKPNPPAPPPDELLDDELNDDLNF